MLCWPGARGCLLEIALEGMEGAPVMTSYGACSLEFVWMSLKAKKRNIKLFVRVCLCSLGKPRETSDRCKYEASIV